MKSYSVTQLNQYVKNVFEDEFVLQNIAVTGELSEFNCVGGNTFFVLRDSTSSLDCVRFGASEALAKGAQATAIGAIRFYTKTGQVRFVAHTIRLSGEGERHLALLALKNQLASEGLLDKRVPLPSVVRRVAVVTSREGAVIHDFISVAHARDRALDILLYPVRVQGEGADLQIAKAIADINAHNIVDIIVIARGGGSEMDLQVFNNEVAVRAVAASRIPIVSAIGHETDYTLCDLVASARAGTPSIAAQMVVQDAAIKRDIIVSEVQALVAAMSALEGTQHRRMAQLVQKLSHAAALSVDRTSAYIARQVQQLSSKTRERHVDLESVVRQQTQLLESNNPAKLILQGYAKLEVDGRAVSSVRMLQATDNIKVYMSDGTLGAVIKELHAYE
jgi:exodeoxyribonuclease VII large subunit